jgi:hypothetical protein
VASSFPSVKDLTLETREMNMDGCLLADDGEADEESASQVPGQTSEQMEERLLARVHNGTEDRGFESRQGVRFLGLCKLQCCSL